MNKLLNTDYSLNLKNYNEDDVIALNAWALELADEVESLEARLTKANKIIYQIYIMADEQ